MNKLRLVRDPAAYYFIGNGSNNKTASSDRSDYKTVCTAMSTLGFATNETQTIWNIVAGILHLVSNLYKNKMFFSTLLIFFPHNDYMCDFM